MTTRKQRKQAPSSGSVQFALKETSLRTPPQSRPVRVHILVKTSIGYRIARRLRAAHTICAAVQHVISNDWLRSLRQRELIEAAGGAGGSRVLKTSHCMTAVILIAWDVKSRTCCIWCITLLVSNGNRTHSTTFPATSSTSCYKRGKNATLQTINCTTHSTSSLAPSRPHCYVSFWRSLALDLVLYVCAC